MKADKQGRYTVYSQYCDSALQIKFNVRYIRHGNKYVDCPFDSFLQEHIYINESIGVL